MLTKASFFLLEISHIVKYYYYISKEPCSILIYYKMKAKLNFQQPLLLSSMLHDPSDISKWNKNVLLLSVLNILYFGDSFRFL